MSEPLLILEHVNRTFRVKGQTIKAVDDINLNIQAGEILCLVGESGCGKTTTGKMIAGVLAPSSGSILYQGEDLRLLGNEAKRKYRLGVQMIHQDPYASLNPAHTVQDILAGPLQHHGLTRS